VKDELRKLPSVDRVLSDEQLRQLALAYPHARLLDVVRQTLEQSRRATAAGQACPSLDEILTTVSQRLHALGTPGLHRVVNATGVLLHTNLGRASLSEAATAGQCNLEFDLDSGHRGSRNDHIEPILCQLTGAEAALVVNNNAAAVLLALTALARRREVIISRSQAVEIGGGFRIPAVMRQSGAKLVEVGTTNCTYLADYEEAITKRTAALMRVHSSNFKQLGFTHAVTLEELMALGEHHNLPVFDDVGSGALLDTTDYGLDPEPIVPQSIGAGAGLVMFSGDKLLGGPQAGIIAGRKDLVDRLKKHPLYRASRLDKVRLAGLMATLVHYLKGEATEKIPLWRLIAAPLDDIDRRARTWAAATGGKGRVTDGEAVVGGGSLPGGTLPTRLVAIGGEGKRGVNVQKLAQELRNRELPVIGRISGQTLLLDPRSVLPEEDETVMVALRETLC
jgi:L-seryl-tRNA(Ser) seleniumtransferase